MGEFRPVALSWRLWLASLVSLDGRYWF